METTDFNITFDFLAESDMELDDEFNTEIGDDFEDALDADPDDSLEDDLDDDPDDDFEDDLDDDPDDDFEDDLDDDPDDDFEDDLDDDPDDNFEDDLDADPNDDPDDDLDDDIAEAYDAYAAVPDHGNMYDVSNYENFDPATADLAHIVGEVVEDMESWHQQEGNTCAVCAQEFVLEALTGQEFHMDQLVELAAEKGWFDAAGGTPLADVGNLLEHYGLQVNQSFDGTIEDIENCLNSGGKVIVAVDADELWNGKSDDFFLPGRDCDHAVQVVGFDYSNPEQPMVILNDSGPSNGCGAMLPLEEFAESWEDSNFFMVTAYQP